MTAEVGKREAHKIATRRAIQEAADALFAEQGFATTTVRKIADAAGVTERTFFRYFPGKEALLVEDVKAWLPKLGEAIRNRPIDEAPLNAIENAIFDVGEHLWVGARPNLSWLFLDGPPAGRLVNAGPGLLLEFEQAIAHGLDRRAGPSPGRHQDAVFVNQVIARTAVAALRSAGIRHWQLRDDHEAERLAPGELVRQALAVQRALSQ